MGGFKKNNPGCSCCQDPFCCDGSPPATLTATVQTVTGTGGNFYCSDTSCSNSWDNSPGGITLTRAGNSCSWGALEVVEPLCGNPSFGCDLVARVWTATLINFNGNWILRLDVGTSAPIFDPGGSEFVRWEYDFLTFRPTCAELTGLSLTLITEISCCSFSGSLVQIN